MCCFIIWALGRVNGERRAPASLPLAKERPVSIEQEIAWVSEPVWMLWRKDKTIASAGKKHHVSSDVEIVI